MHQYIVFYLDLWIKQEIPHHNFENQCFVPFIMEMPCAAKALNEVQVYFTGTLFSHVKTELHPLCNIH